MTGKKWIPGLILAGVLAMSAPGTMAEETEWMYGEEASAPDEARAEIQTDTTVTGAGTESADMDGADHTGVNGQASTERITAETGTGDTTDTAAGDNVDVAADSEEGLDEGKTLTESFTEEPEEYAETENESESETENARPWYQITFKDILAQLLGGVVLICLPGCYIYWRAKR